MKIECVQRCMDSAKARFFKEGIHNVTIEDAKRLVEIGQIKRFRACLGDTESAAFFASLENKPTDQPITTLENEATDDTQVEVDDQSDDTQVEVRRRGRPRKE